MKRLKISIYLCIPSIILALFCTSCDLDLAPIDYYGSGSFWKTEAHVVGYMDGLHNDLRKKSFQHQFIFGEARGGSSMAGSSCSGSSIDYGVIKTQALSATNTGVTGWGDLYGRITNVNLFIQETHAATFMSDEKKAYYLGQAYGLRAFWYFDLYRVYGSCPLQLEPKVVNGVIEPEELYAERSSPAAIMKQIKSDLNESLKYFGDDKTIKGQKAYWSKAATECLVGEVYLWTSKVSTGDDKANTADLLIAKKHLLNVTTAYGFKLLPDFSNIFDATPAKKGNDEIIMAVRYAEGEQTNSMSQFVYNWMTSNFNGAWLFEDGTLINKDTLQLGTAGIQRNEFKKGLFLSYDKEDMRRDATFLSVYDKTTKELAGTYVRKNLGYFSTTSNVRVFCGDEILYRLSWVYLALAEIENMEGGNPAKYINMVRQRAYGSAWDAAKHAYVNSDFTKNELAILAEKDKEFVCEGQRWWDVRRMTLTKGGKHLVFCPEGNIDSNTPLLDEKEEAYKVLWPIEVAMLNKDPKLVQTEGY